MTSAEGSTRRRGSLLAGIGVGLGAVAWGLLQLLQSTLPSFHLRATPQLLIALSIGIVGVAVAQRQAARARRDDEDALVGALDLALACWPPRTAAALSPYDLGAHPTGARPDEPAAAEPLPPYVPRALDGELASALAADSLVVVYGPARAGKTRTAYEAVRRAGGDARLLVPENADGLAVVLRHADRLAAVAGEPLVLWLDELERFLPGLDLDALDRLAAPGGSLRTIATIGEQSLAELLAEGAPAGSADRHLARRLLARARALHLPAPSAAERRAVADAAGGTGSLRAQLGAGWWPAPLPPLPSAVRHRSLDLVALALGLVAAALVVLTLVSGFRDGWTEPPPLKDQLAALHDDAPECETVETSPASADDIGKRTVLVAVGHRELCLDSDEVRLYRVREERLRQFATLHPPAGSGRRTFACLGPDAADACGVAVVPGIRVLAGAFADARTHQALPLALRPLAAGLNLVALAPQQPAGDRRLVRTVLALDRSAVALRFGGGPSAADDPGTAAVDARCAGSDGCVRGFRAQAWTVFPGTAAQQAVVVGGYLEQGTPDAPRVLLARARQLLLDGGAPAAGRACWIFTHGRRVAVTAHVSSEATAGASLAAAWRRALAKPGSAIVC
jgi:hypothetical protein